jgi:pimeloyl-ACP methyl ester carboxylesterase
MHQTPALHRAGYETIVFDNRGTPPSDAPPGDYSLADLTADTVALIEKLGIGPCHVVGTSMGAMIAQELTITRSDLVRCAVLIATRARSDVTRRMMHAADREVTAAGVTLPAKYAAVRTVLEMLSPATLNDDHAAAEWLDLFELIGNQSAPGQDAVSAAGDQRDMLRRISVPCRAIAFADDLICPPHLVLEVADAIPGCDFLQIPECGHLGYLEKPAEVNAAIIEFLEKY